MVNNVVNFVKYLQEADEQKEKVNKGFEKTDASHGDKADNVDKKVTPKLQEADKQKEDVNKGFEKTDASHGDKADNVDKKVTPKLQEAEINESLKTIAKIVKVSTDGSGGLVLSIFDEDKRVWVGPIMLSKTEYAEFKKALPWGDIKMKKFETYLAESIKEKELEKETNDDALKESLLEALSGLDTKFIEANKDKQIGEKAVSVNGTITPFIILVNNEKTFFIIHKKGASIGAITYDKTNDTKAEVILTKDALKNLH